MGAVIGLDGMPLGGMDATAPNVADTFDRGANAMARPRGQGAGEGCACEQRKAQRARKVIGAVALGVGGFLVGRWRYAGPRR